MEEKIKITEHKHSEIVKQIHVRLILPEEKSKWDLLMQTHHYLGLRSLVGKTLRYVAVFQNNWLALLGWQAAALKCKARDEWIGWSPILQYQRLHLIANNTRFLILPLPSQIYNLASKVLSLNLKRLSKDFKEVYGHPVLLAETFVDKRFTGACYRAANWQVVGNTKGFRKSGKRYYYHGNSKSVLMYSLIANSKQSLCTPVSKSEWRCNMHTNIIKPTDLEKLQSSLQSLPDHRHNRGVRHLYSSVLTIAIGAILSGAKGYSAIAEWAKRLTQNQLKRVSARYDRKNKKFKPPSEPTIRRILQSSDVEIVEKTLGEWLMEITDKNDNISVDGKTVRGARREDRTQVHLLSAFLHNQGVTVAQLEVDKKTNEIPEIKSLLKPLDLEGRVVTADAMHTQRETARFIVEDKKADYLFIVKENQKNLLDDITSLNPDDFSPGRNNNK